MDRPDDRHGAQELKEVVCTGVAASDRFRLPKKCRWWQWSTTVGPVQLFFQYGATLVGPVETLPLAGINDSISHVHVNPGTDVFCVLFGPAGTRCYISWID